MTITDPLSFWGNAIAFIVLAAKTLYDLVINPRQFRRESVVQDILVAARKKRERSDLSTAITFLVLAFSSALMMWALVKFE